MANKRGRHDIDIHRNVIEQFLMDVRDFIKQNSKRVLLVFLGVVSLFVIVVSTFVYVDSSATASREKFEAAVENYRADPLNGDVQKKTIDELKALIDDTSFGFAHRMSHYILGNIYFERKEYKAAADMLTLFAEKSSSDDLFIPIALNKAALSLEESGDAEGALAVLLKVESDTDESAVLDQVIYNIGRLYAVKGNKVKAREYFNKVMASYPESSYSDRAKERLFLLSLN